MKSPEIHTITIQVCAITGDPGCLGWPEWHDGPCLMVPATRLACECGGDDVYSPGYIAHDPDCPLAVGDEL